LDKPKKIQVPRAKNFHLKRKQAVKTMCAKRTNLQSNCPRIVGQAQNSKCLEQEFSNMKENRQCEPFVPSKTICNRIVKEQLDNLKNSKCLKREFSFTKENRQCKPGVQTKQSNFN